MNRSRLTNLSRSRSIGFVDSVQFLTDAVQNEPTLYIYSTTSDLLRGSHSAVAYVTKMGSRKNCVLIFGHCYRCVLTIDSKLKIDVAIFFVEP